MNQLLNQLKSKLIVSCQAPVNSPLHHPELIAAIATACVNQGAAGVRIDTPSHVQAVRKQLPAIPIIGLWKQQNLGSEVYITPRYQDAYAIAQAGADIIAIDATTRERPGGETVTEIIERIHAELGKLVMADVDSFENAQSAVAAGANVVGTTLYGYTQATKHLIPPGYDLLAEMVEKLTVPVICEGGIASPTMAKQALELGADAVVVGTAITGIDLLTQSFQSIFE
ncbi:N-acetylmannosamine-6-phosphate 2-epimerase [Stanieria cyanosphaera PCC 7437]|uniref:Putative N-acetylmannosamine-6-phosphate 2-epimerase n=1 Tax=Stanieria cyanosphaera (strain ATCC 29371 / PCC 7437) TaxID=111780 RepID=K9XR12_STAC7|nr:N-acetylmannosamine-6-phosphate 2-epimerase [Stanieria cyanosphaera]AFZ34529.1 N-acetylmannosamine-6-phosphate 2-epimerase [Stanieria cyanosphaera PCC 7437]